MIRHIVLFKFKEDVDEERRTILISALNGLRDKISLVKELEVGVDIGNKHNSYDIVLNSLFNTFDDVEAYAVHPEHLKVVDLVKEMCQSSVKVDFDTDSAY
ncbi:MAG: Dabb family protein [Proteobacteria bacterium]|nr:Dabb family protein [Pseudomonadota bacterium]